MTLTWTSIGAIAPRYGIWLFLGPIPTDANWLRLTHTNPPPRERASALVAQVDMDDRSFFGSNRVIFPSTDAEVIYLPLPPDFDQRGIAIQSALDGIDPRWEIQVEVATGPDPFGTEPDLSEYYTAAEVDQAIAAIESSISSSPTSLSELNPAHWLKASLGYSYGGWIDQVSGQVFTPVVAMPPRVTNAINGKPIVQFGSAAVSLANPSVNFAANGEYSIVAAGRVGSIQPHGALVFKAGANASDEVVRFAHSGGGQQGLLQYQNVLITTPGTYFIAGDYCVYELSVKSNSFYFYLNGALVGAIQRSTAQTNLAQNGPLYIGTILYQGMTNYFVNIALAELAIFSKPISSKQRSQYLELFNAEYGL